MFADFDESSLQALYRLHAWLYGDVAEVPNLSKQVLLWLQGLGV